MPDGTQQSTAAGRERRAISPIVGTVMMIAILLAMSSVLVVGLTTFTPTLSTPEYANESPKEGSLSTAEYADLNPDAGSLSTSNSSAGAQDISHRVKLDVDDEDSVAGDSIQRLTVEYDAGATLVGVKAADLGLVGIDTNGDGTVDVDLGSGVTEVSTTNDSIRIAFDSTAELSAGDSLIVEYAGVANGAAGTHDVRMTVNDADAWTATFELLKVEEGAGIQTQLVRPELGTPGATERTTAPTPATWPPTTS